MKSFSLSNHFPFIQNSSFNHPRGVLFVFCICFAAAVPAVKADYTFRIIADSTGPFSSLGDISLNASGTVAFSGRLDDGSYGIFKSDGIATTTIFSTTVRLAILGNPSINRAGTVAFATRAALGEAVFSGNGGPLTTIADTTGPFSSFSGTYSTAINVSGTVAFTASLDSGGGGYFASTGGVVTPLFLNTPTLHPDFNFTFNDAGTVAFRAYFGQTGATTGIVAHNNGLVTTIVDSSGLLNYFGSAPSLNSTGTVAFVAGVGGIDGGTYGIYSGNGGLLTTIADLSGPFSAFPSFDFGNPSINDSGTVGFIAGLDVGGAGVFVGDGTATSEVIGIGDALFGSTIATFNISPTSLNDSGQLAFYYRLANGTTGIALANPVPEPSATLLLAVSLGLSLSRRASRQRRAT